ncbi:MAG: hypothetical protein QM296_08390 [Bacillota bacterium]|nr:hypothetical protein [Bacillota bacterium]
MAPRGRADEVHIVIISAKPDSSTATNSRPAVFEPEVRAVRAGPASPPPLLAVTGAGALEPEQRSQGYQWHKSHAGAATVLKRKNCCWREQGPIGQAGVLTESRGPETGKLLFCPCPPSSRHLHLLPGIPDMRPATDGEYSWGEQAF